MFRLRQLVAAIVVACAVVAAPAAAQGPVTSIAGQLQQQAIDELLRTQQIATLRSVALDRNGTVRAGTSTALPPLRLSTLEDSVARYELLHRQNRRWSHPLLALGAAALAGGFASTVAGDAREISGLQRTLIWGGFGITVLGSQQWKAAGRAQVQADQWRSIHVAAGQQPRR